MNLCKKLLALSLAALLVFSMLPLTAMAQESTPTEPTPTEAVAPTETTAATEATETPTESTEAATEATEAPTESTEAPTEATEAPTESTEAPTEATEAPTESTEAPTEATEAPTESTEAPTEATEAPTEATEAPTAPTEDPIQVQLNANLDALRPWLEKTQLTPEEHIAFNAAMEAVAKFCADNGVTALTADQQSLYDQLSQHLIDTPTTVENPVAKIGEIGYATLAAAIAAVQDGQTITLTDGTHAWDASWQIKNKTVTFTGSRSAIIDMTNIATGQNTSGATLAFNGVTVKFGTENYKGFQHTAKVSYTNCAITGKQFLYAPTVEFTGCSFENYADYCVWTYGASSVSFANCQFTTGGKAILVYNESTTSDFVANIALSCCTFTSNGSCATDKAAVETGQTPYGTNTYNLSFNSCTASNFAANNSASSLVGNKNSMNSTTLLAVIDGTPAYVAKINDQGYMTLAEAIAAAQSGDTITLTDGTYKWDASWQIKNKAVTFAGSRNAVIDMTNIATGQNTSGATLAFNGVTVKFGTENYKGFQHTAKVSYTNCALTGKQFLYAPVAEFTGCSFENYADYCVWTYGASNVTFSNCQFTTGGKAILVYNESSTSDFVANIALSGCTFTSNGSCATDKAAVETGQTPYGINTYNLSFNGCTASGFVANKSSSSLWGNKNSMVFDNLDIIVDGNNGRAPEIIATVNGTPYASLQEAINAAESEGVITLVQNTQENITTQMENEDGTTDIKRININLNGKTLSGTIADSSLFFGGSGTVTSTLSGTFNISKARTVTMAAPAGYFWGQDPMGDFLVPVAAQGEFTTFTIKASWDDGSYAHRPAAQNIYLMYGGKVPEGSAPLVLSAANNWTLQVSVPNGLPKNRQLVYSQDLSIAAETLNGYTTSVSGEVKQGSTITITNSRPYKTTTVYVYSEHKLLQTGAETWPAPVLVFAGVSAMASGLWLLTRKKGSYVR